MNNKFTILREKYQRIIYKSYEITNSEDSIKLNYIFEIPGLDIFNHSITIPKENLKNNNINQSLLKSMVFRLGLVELINYYKCVCPKIIEIEAGYIDKYEEDWFKKLYYNGLGEFFYVNGINVDENKLFKFEINGLKLEIGELNYQGNGNLIPVGGGKDSCVTLELLKDCDNTCFVVNDKQVDHDCIGDIKSCFVKRVKDNKLNGLNKQGYLDGHTPYSAMLAFLSYLIAYLCNRKYVVLSNEGSAEEPTIIGTNINHQYSKTYEFEKDFDEYTKKVFKIDIEYFSFLRPIKEIQIAYLFSKFKKYHKIFRSCNVNSKYEPWLWCNSCAKCLFIFIILRAFMDKEEVTEIFGENLLNKKELENHFLELIGKSKTKPFECVGTIDEVNYAMNRIIMNDDSYLSNLYREKYFEKTDIDLTKLYYENNLDNEFLNIIKDALNK